MEKIADEVEKRVRLRYQRSGVYEEKEKERNKKVTERERKKRNEREKKERNRTVTKQSLRQLSCRIRLEEGKKR
jgi:hypothetical protein